MVIIGGFILLLGGLASWATLDLPHPPLNTTVDRAQKESRQEIAQVEEFSMGTRRLVLSDRWFRLKAQISQVKSRLAPGLSRPGPEARSALEALLVQLEAQLKGS